jgi:outer membrane autotransporter protein
LITALSAESSRFEELRATRRRTGQLNLLIAGNPLQLAQNELGAASTQYQLNNYDLSAAGSYERLGKTDLIPSAEYERFTKKVTAFEPGHKTNTGRIAVIGDYVVGNGFLVGGALKYARDNGHFDTGGGFRTNAYGLQLHGNYLPTDNAFVHSTAGYTWSNSDLSRVQSVTSGGSTSAGTIDGDVKRKTLHIDVNSGYQFNFQNITFGPRLALRYNRTRTGSYTERGNTGLELAYDAQSEKSLTGVLGVQGSTAISTRFGVVSPQVTLEYLHEFQDSQRLIGFRFVDNPTAGPFRFQSDPPDRNYFNLGLGAVMQWRHDIAGFVNYRAQAGYRDQTRHTVSVGVRIPLQW